MFSRSIFLANPQLNNPTPHLSRRDCTLFACVAFQIKLYVCKSKAPINAARIPVLPTFFENW